MSDSEARSMKPMPLATLIERLTLEVTKADATFTRMQLHALGNVESDVAAIAGFSETSINTITDLTFRLNLTKEHLSWPRRLWSQLASLFGQKPDPTRYVLTAKGSAGSIPVVLAIKRNETGKYAGELHGDKLTIENLYVADDIA